MKGNTHQGDTSSASDTKKTSEGAKARKSILVIDDELGPRESLKILLKDKYSVITADSGDKGIECFKNGGVDVIILDLRMPGKTGIETLEEIRKTDKNIPVIILTGYGDMATAKKAIHLGAVEFLNKPFDIAEMLAVVKKACEKKEIEEQSKTLIRELDSLNLKLKDNMAKIENMATIGQLSAEIIHDVNNILTVIYGYVQLLMAETDPTKLSANNKYISTIEEGIKKCRNITNSVVELSKIKMEIKPININGVIIKVADFFQNSSIAKNIKFTISTDNSIPFINADPIQLHKALINVVLNGIQAIGEKGEIEISTRKEADNAVVSIRDNGKGIDPSITGKIFEPSFTTKENGTGLGLATTERVIRKHQGRIEVKSTVHKGTEFIIYLPLWSSNR